MHCRRKKDHGRAEALLLAAWGVGVRRTTADHDVAAANAEALAELNDTNTALDHVQEATGGDVLPACATSSIS